MVDAHGYIYGLPSSLSGRPVATSILGSDKIELWDLVIVRGLAVSLGDLNPTINSHCWTFVYKVLLAETGAKRL